MKRITLAVVLLAAMASTTPAQAKNPWDQYGMSEHRERILTLEQMIREDKKRGDYEAAREHTRQLHRAQFNFDREHSQRRREESLNRY